MRQAVQAVHPVRGMNASRRAKMQSSSSVAYTDPGVRSRHKFAARGGFAVKDQNRAQRVLRIPIPSQENLENLRNRSVT